jgi:hypothetical protein
MQRTDDLPEQSRAGASTGYVPHPGIIITDLGDGLVLLDPTNGEMYSLQGPGRVAWSALGEGEAAAVDALVARFEVERERAAADVAALLRDLLQAGLIVERPGGDARP